MEPSYDMTENIVLPFADDPLPTPLIQLRRRRHAQEAHEESIKKQRRAQNENPSLREQCWKEIAEGGELRLFKDDRLQEIYRTFDYSKVQLDIAERQQLIQLARERAEIMENEHAMLVKLKADHENVLAGSRPSTFTELLRQATNVPRVDATSPRQRPRQAAAGTSVGNRKRQSDSSEIPQATAAETDDIQEPLEVGQRRRVSNKKSNGVPKKQAKNA